jgi:hypothetical protein
MYRKYSKSIGLKTTALNSVSHTISLKTTSEYSVNSDIRIKIFFSQFEYSIVKKYYSAQH